VIIVLSTQTQTPALPRHDGPHTTLECHQHSCQTCCINTVRVLGTRLRSKPNVFTEQRTSVYLRYLWGRVAAADPAAAATYLARYEALARAVTGSEAATVEQGVEWMVALVKDCGVPGLGDFGLKEEDFAEVGGFGSNHLFYPCTDVVEYTQPLLSHSWVFSA